MGEVSSPELGLLLRVITGAGDTAVAPFETQPEKTEQVCKLCTAFEGLEVY